MNLKHAPILFILLALSAGLLTCRTVSADIVMQTGQKVAFLGDSITAYGWDKPAGYVRLVVAGLAANGVTVNPIPAGVGGNTSIDMAARVNKDVISKTPDWVLLSCGVNDAFPVRNVSVDQYESNITNIVEQCLAAHIKVVLLTPTPIGENFSDPLNTRLAVFNQFLQQLAIQKGCLFADVNAALMNAIKSKTNPAYTFTVDNVHMDPAGDFVMASCILKTLGVDDPGIKKAQEQWMDIPGGVPLQVTIPMTPRQWFSLQDAAAGENKNVPTYLGDAFAATLPNVKASK